MKPDPFEQKLKREKYMVAALFLVFLMMYIFAKIELYPKRFYQSCGFSGAVVTAVSYIRLELVLRHPDNLSAYRIKVTDERNNFIEKQAYSTYAVLSLVFLLAVILVAGFVVPAYSPILFLVFAGHAVLLLICLFYFQKKY
ncbi:hypothetical protein H9X85_00775 [Anaerotignum lactatifermentans]|uniref:DUF3169 domain-containing protein n=1 Tax=Anaerotignum lactatifermentans TaxID=160404 RepID=A0ABS2G723_9FIRM|nr:hypothetical protein [Anaerotignum lactatifermentans]MBM6828160.1 hypothetical protein [Anaerotignum lactatifermentans]MBM6876677.1 hypothetical protein [Anaerotignum lactatifermentans]MBM6949743.1 hypothetical protein [Anaerotignum lactatifermentans]